MQDRLPDFVNTIMGIFDPDFNTGIQRRNLQRAQLGLQRSQSSLVRADQRRQLLVNAARSEKKQALDILQITQQGLLDDIAVNRAGFEVEQNIRKETVQFAQDRSIAELQKFQRNPETTPPELKGKPGLINTVLRIKQSSRTTLSAQEFNLSIQRRVLDKQDFLSSFQSIEEIQNFSGVFPEGVSQIDLAELQERFVRADTSLQTMRLALAAKNAAVFEAAKVTFFGTQDSRSLKGMLATAKKTGSFDAGGGLIFSARRIQTELASALEREQKELVTLEQETLATSQLAGNLLTGSLVDEQFAGIYDPTNPVPTTDTIPVDVLQELSNSNSRIALLKERINESAIQQDGNTAALMQMLNTELEAKTDFFKAQVEERAENDFDDESRAAFREHAFTGNVSVTNAIPLLGGVGGNSTIFIDNDIMDSPWTGLSTEFALTAADRRTSISAGAGGEGLTALSGKPRDSVILEEAAQNSEFRTKVIANAQMAAMAMAVNQLAEEEGSASARIANDPSNAEQLTNQVNLFSKLRNVRNGQLAPRFFEENGSFSLELFLQETAQATIEGQQAGVLQPGENVAGVVFDRARAGISVVMDKAFAGLYGKAVESMFFGRSARSMAQTLIDASIGKIPPSVANADALNAERDRFIDRAIIMQEQRGLGKEVPAAGPPSPQSQGVLPR